MNQNRKHNKPTFHPLSLSLLSLSLLNIMSDTEDIALEEEEEEVNDLDQQIVDLRDGLPPLAPSGDRFNPHTQIAPSFIHNQN